MPILAFDMNTENLGTRRLQFRGKNKTDYYDGDLRSLSDDIADMTIQKNLAGEFAIYNLVSRAGLSFRRNWSHIRHDKVDTIVFWFLRHGSITISSLNKTHELRPDECAFTLSTKAFYIALMPDSDGALEVMHVAAPTHKLYPMVTNTQDVGIALPSGSGVIRIADRILSLLFVEGDHLDQIVAGRLVETVLMNIIQSVEHPSDPLSQRTSVERRAADIQRFVNQNFANQNLNSSMTASACEMSPRQLYYVLKANGLSFSSFVWERRLVAAQEWLADKKMSHLSISAISLRAGFKSSAHFGRMFKKRYCVSPGAYRQQHLDPDAGLQTTGLIVAS